MTTNSRNGVSHHILGAAATLSGISFAVGSVIGALGHSEKTLIDDCAMVSLGLFLGSCLFSYASIRYRRLTRLCETVADVFFVLGLLSLGALSLFLSFGWLS